MRRAREVFDTALVRILLTAARWRFIIRARGGMMGLVAELEDIPRDAHDKALHIMSIIRDPSFTCNLTDVACCKARQQDGSASTEASSLALDESQLQPWRHANRTCSICTHKKFYS